MKGMRRIDYINEYRYIFLSFYPIEIKIKILKYIYESPYNIIMQIPN